MNHKKKIIIMMMIIILIICVISVIIIYLNKKNSEEEIQRMIEQKIGDPLNVEYFSQQLNDPTKFFSVENCIKHNLDENFIAEDMHILNEEIIASYAVKGKIGDNDDDIYVLVRVDNDNMTYSIERIDYDAESLNEIDLSTDITYIPDEGDNTFEYITVTSEDMCRKYLEDFVQKELNDPEEAYSLIDEEYKSIRFPTFEEYQAYIEEYQGILQNASLSQYSVEMKEDYTEYILVDNYNTSYTIKAEGIWDYTIRLDNYTIKVDTYEEDYNQLSEEQKVQTNVQIFLQMINTKDYRHAYAVLDETFKNNNFNTLDSFHEYVNNNFFEYNLNTTSNISVNKEGNTYIYETTIKSGAGSAAEAKTFTVIMQLQEGTDFKMSFNIQ